jgi:hypothetical protein
VERLVSSRRCHFPIATRRETDIQPRILQTTARIRECRLPVSQLCKLRLCACAVASHNELATDRMQGNYAARVIKRNPWFTFCFIPVLPLSIHGHQDVVCSICRFAQPLENRQDVVAMANGGGGGAMPLQHNPQGGPPQGWGGGPGGGQPPKQQQNMQYG